MLRLPLPPLPDLTFPLAIPRKLPPGKPQERHRQPRPGLPQELLRLHPPEHQAVVMPQILETGVEAGVGVGAEVGVKVEVAAVVTHQGLSQDGVVFLDRHHLSQYALLKDVVVFASLI